MKTAKRLEVPIELIEQLHEQYGGLCVKCGAEHLGIEPDFRRGKCDECGRHAVYGAQECVIAGLVKVISWGGRMMVLLLNAGNDFNGNSRRLWLWSDASGKVKACKQYGVNPDELCELVRRSGYVTVNIKPVEFRQLLKIYGAQNV